jgi:hypothetical protein
MPSKIDPSTSGKIGETFSKPVFNAIGKSASGDLDGQCVSSKCD